MKNKSVYIIDSQLIMLCVIVNGSGDYVVNTAQFLDRRYKVRHYTAFICLEETSFVGIVFAI